METATLIKEQLVLTYEQLISGVIGSAPLIISGIVLIALAIVIAKIMQTVTRFVLRKVQFDALVARIGIDQSLRRIGISAPLSSVLPQAAYYLLLFLFAGTLADGLGLEPISNAINGFLAFVPNMVSAFLIVLLGSAVGQFAGTAIARSAKATGLDFGDSLGKMVSGLILFIALLMAIGQLRVDTDIVRIVTACGFAGFALAFALSFGLGTREITRSLLAGFYARNALRMGDEVEISGHRGILRAITPTLTIIRCDEEDVLVSNTKMLDEVVRTRAVQQDS